MTSLPSGLASISARMDDAPNVRGAVDMAKRLRRAEALSALAEMDAPLIDAERPEDVALAVARARLCAKTAEAAYDLWSKPDLTSAFDRHAALAIGSADRSADRR